MLLILIQLRWGGEYYDDELSVIDTSIQSKRERVSCEEAAAMDDWHIWDRDDCRKIAKRTYSAPP